jgi:hypothetical protein
MSTATNVDATAVSTIEWLSTEDTTIVVPVYQRQYRWDIGGCEQLLADIRSVADGADDERHFIGSILSTKSAEGDELVLIDGQQRITTLMLLIAALHHTAPSPELEKALIGRDGGTKLRPHRAWADAFERVVLDRRDDTESRFDDNYAFFRSQVPPSEVSRIWRGLQRLEHVAITLGAHANAQQIFESLNSTGEPLRDHELIHNYMLMGLTHSEQSEIEDDFWLPIERNTGDAIAGFWRHYLVATTGREIETTGGRGVYDAFRQRFPHLDIASLRAHAAEWREYSALYRTLLDPSLEPDPAIARQLGYVNTFGRGMYPLVMLEYRDHELGRLDVAALVTSLEHIQALLLRRTIVGTSTRRLVARLCRAREEGDLAAAISRITPSDERVRVALKYGALPHPAYVLGRLAGVDSLAALDVDHIVPLAPGDAWTGDGIREWSELGEDEQNSHRALAETLGNLTLLESSLAERAIDASYPDKRASVYATSSVALNRELAETVAWGTAAIAERTARLTADLVRIWAIPATVGIDDDGLTPILDATERRGWPRGWEREFEYVEYRGEHWDVFDIKYLFNRVFKRLWADSRESVLAFTERRGGPIFDSMAWQGHWDTIDESRFLYMGWDSRYMLSAIQGVLDEAGIAPEVFLKYSYIGDAMARS